MRRVPVKRAEPGLYLERQRGNVDRYLAALLEGDASPPRLREAMRYSVAAGGKRLRPLLTVAAAETLGLPGEQVLAVAAAFELVHTYSLIHDDLPAMDDGMMRRGRPTCHRAHGEALAILAGDALLTLAFEQVAAYGLREGCAERALQISLELARAAGREGMVGGQVLDLEAEGRSVDLAALELIDRCKTGALLEAAVRCGALAAGASPAELDSLKGYSSCLGLAFQITDDLLDREGSTAELGKDAGADGARGKATFPALLGAEAARERSKELYRRALLYLEELGRPAELLEELARQLVFRDR
ncbi:MAG: polyprenyl synthetase family protein [Firmicutes bacterium]|nr:polyprenyl synthetase family protein [Bacillota bacterium]